MFPRFSPNYNWRDIAAALLPANKNAVREFEQNFLKRSGYDLDQNCALTFRYGRAGLYYLLKALGAKNKKVIMPSYSCVVVAHAVKLSGNIPVFLDNAPNAFQPAPQDYLEAIKKEGAENICMIMPTHLFGIAQDTKKLCQTVKKKYPHIFILQDCAHSYFCEDGDKEIVTTHGDGALFGMNISKLLNSVKGGALILRDKALAGKLRAVHLGDLKKQEEVTRPSLTQSLIARIYVVAASGAFMPFFYGLVYWLMNNTKLLSGQTDYYSSDTIELPQDFRGLMSSFEAHVAMSSLRRYDKRIKKRREIAQIYTEALKVYTQGGERMICNDVPRDTGHTWSHYPFVLKSKEEKKRVMIMLRKEHRCEIGAIVDYSIADMKSYAQSGDHDPCPHAQEMADRIVNLPLTFAENKFLPRFKSHQSYALEISKTLSRLLKD